MKAAVYYETGSPDVFRYEDVPDPVCHPQGVVIRVEAVSIEGGDPTGTGTGPTLAWRSCPNAQQGRSLCGALMSGTVAGSIPSGTAAEVTKPITAAPCE